MTTPLLFSGVNDEIAEQLRIFLDRNHMTYKIFLDLVVPFLYERDNWNRRFRPSPMLEDLDQRYTELVQRDPVLRQQLQMSVVQRFISPVLRPLTREDLAEAKRRVMARYKEEEEANKRGEVTG